MCLSEPHVRWLDGAALIPLRERREGQGMGKKGNCSVNAREKQEAAAERTAGVCLALESLSPHVATAHYARFGGDPVAGPGATRAP